MADKINVFISHCGEDEKYIEKFKSLMSNEYEIRDSSLVSSEPNNATNEDYIKNLIRPQIDWAGTIIVLISPETHKHEWVNWEIEYAAKSGDKTIIGVFVPGATDADMPEMLENYGDSCVSWNDEKIKEAINSVPTWTDSSGNIRPAGGARGNC